MKLSLLSGYDLTNQDVIVPKLCHSRVSTTDIHFFLGGPFLVK